MEEEKRSRGEALRKFILSEIRNGGPVPFSRFMEWCLYHPDYGYYRSEGTRTGKHGDFYTGPCVHPVFGALIAKQLHQMAEQLGGNTFDIVEQGAGKGFLCEDILQWTKRNVPSFYRHLRYYLLEISSSLIREQRERLALYEKEGKVFWMGPAAFEGGKSWVEGCFLSNELVDAFPVHQIVVKHGEFKEIYVTEDHGRLIEQHGELSDSRIASYFESIDISLQEGQRAEVNLMALDWMEKVARWMKRGFVLTIDYGYCAEELYSPSRREGTVLCYARHQTSDNPYDRLGEQDITSHVNFTSLIRKGEEVGLRFTGLVPQYRFLIALGLLQEMASLEKEMSGIDALQLRLSIKHLIEPERGMGEVFKVLIQHKGMAEPELDGLRELRSIRWQSSRL
jgi:SAM-dependent MidA family methyltransferase